jgi:long-chain acyl-CoA synthetase
VESIIDHSESKLVFINNALWENINKDNVKVTTIESPSFTLLKSIGDNTDEIVNSIDFRFKQSYPDGFSKKDIKYAKVDNSEVVCINYTSGTTGYSKGVMITANNFAGNITYADKLNLLFAGERILAFLPMAHVYGCAFDFLYSLSTGVHITLLGVSPTPQNLINALDEVRPNIIITVPLIFEKIYKKKILPVISQPVVKFLLKIKGVDKLILNKIKKSIIKSLGGNFREVVIGGAALNTEVEAFFHRMQFPFTVGYGMTECAPLIAYDHHKDFVPTSCGSVLKDIMEARIDSTDPENIPGEIQVRGENVMSGYYRNSEATKAAFTDDGWLKTGDLGIMRGSRLFIKGRLKTMILSANGQNIYPEEIESRLNNLPYISDSVVVLRENKLVALIYPDKDALRSNNISSEELIEIMEVNKGLLNKAVAKYERLSGIEIMENEFEKTPKKSIKRYLYQ